MSGSYNRTFYDRIGGDSGIEKCVREHTWFYQPFRRKREMEFLSSALRRTRSEDDLVQQYDSRIKELHDENYRIVAKWIFSNRVRCRDVIAFVNENEQTSSLI